MPVNLDAIVAKTFDILDATVPDTVMSVTYLQAAVAIYDPQTRSYNHGICSHETFAVKARPSAEEFDGESITHDTAKFVIASDKLPSVAPKAQDNLRTEDGQLWNITKVGSVPGESLHILYAEQTT